MFTFKAKPFIIFLALFLIEVVIAKFFHDKIIRPFLGDFLAVIALYFLLKSFLKFSVSTIALMSISIAYLLELLQYLHFIEFAGLEKYKILVIILGSSFDWGDILAYTLGFLFLIFVEKITNKNTVTI